MGTNRQRFLDLFTTLRAILRRVTGINLDYPSSSIFRFVRKEFKEFTPACIGNTLAQMPVSDHAFNIQSFNVDSLVGTYVEINNFVQKIFSLIQYFLMSLGYKDLCFGSSARSSHLTGQCPLSSSQDSFGVPEEFRVRDTSASRVNEKFLNPDINPDFGDSFRHLLDWHVIARKAHKPLAGRSAPDGDGLDIPLNRPGQKEFESSDTGNIQVSAFNLVSGLFQGEGIISILPFESRESGFLAYILTPAKEGVKSTLQSLYHILKHLRAYGLKLKEFLLKVGKLVLLIDAGDRFSMLFIDADSLIERKVVEDTACIEPLIALGFGLFIYYRSILESFSHLFFFKNISMARLINSATDMPVSCDTLFNSSICLVVK